MLPLADVRAHCHRLTNKGLAAFVPYSSTVRLYNHVAAIRKPRRGANVRMRILVHRMHARRKCGARVDWTIVVSESLEVSTAEVNT